MPEDERQRVQTRQPMILWIIVVLLVVALAGVIVTRIEEAEHRRDACEATRAAVISLVVDQNATSREQLRSGSIFKFFPAVPRADLREGIQDTIERRRKTIERLRSEGC